MPQLGTGNQTSGSFDEERNRTWTSARSFQLSTTVAVGDRREVGQIQYKFQAYWPQKFRRVRALSRTAELDYIKALGNADNWVPVRRERGEEGGKSG